MEEADVGLQPIALWITTTEGLGDHGMNTILIVIRCHDGGFLWSLYIATDGVGIPQARLLERGTIGLAWLE
jgi:hypothetical protein